MSTEVSPEKFFGSIVAPHLRELDIPAQDQHTYVFRLFGDPPGEWSVDLARKRVRRGTLAHPDLYLEMDRADFVALLAGQLDTAAAVADGRVRFAGKISFLADLGRVLEPAAA